jgi:biopolymer transport protein TolR
MAMSTGGPEGTSAEINVTPLIDVLLVLLIIFLLIQPTPKVGEKTDIPRPNKSEINIPDPATVVIELHDAGAGQTPKLKINDEGVGWNDLQSRLKEIYRFRAEKIAFLKGDPEVDFQFVAEVLDMTHDAGVDRVGLMGR